MKTFKLKVHLTERTINLAKVKGIYTFIGPVTYTKNDVKALFKDYFGYEVDKVRVVKLPAKVRGRYLRKGGYIKPARKKFYITFKGKVNIPGYNKLIEKKK